MTAKAAISGFTLSVLFIRMRKAVMTERAAGPGSKVKIVKEQCKLDCTHFEGLGCVVVRIKLSLHEFGICSWFLWVEPQSKQS